MRPVDYKDETIIRNPNEASEFWDNEFNGKDIKPSELEFAKVMFSDHATDSQKKELERVLDSNGACLGSSRTLIKYLAHAGDLMLQDEDERKSSKAANFFGSEMDGAVEASVRDNAKSLIDIAIQRATDKLLIKGKRSIPGRM